MAVADLAGARPVLGDREGRARRTMLVLTVLLAAMSVLSLGTGASGASLWAALGQLARGESIGTREAVILFDIRLPRLAMGILVGAALAVSGAVMQGLFRNPLADPGLVGVGAGAGLGAIAPIVLGAALPFAPGHYLVPVAVSGGIGFVGIVVPHLLRLITGPDHRYLLPNAALLGAALLVAADMIARTVIAPAELRIGIVTATLGGPFFLWILLRNRSLLDL